MRTLAKLNPLVLFFMPGSILCLIGSFIAVLLFFGRPIFGFTTHTMITGAMTALVGLQFIIISFTINLIKVEENDNDHSQLLNRLATNIPHNSILFLGIIILFAGLVGFAILVRAWRLEEYQRFFWPGGLVFALSFIVGGFQLISLTFTLSQFKNRTGNEISA